MQYSAKPRLTRLTVQRAAQYIVFSLLFALACRVAVDSDMWWHLRVGQRILQTGELAYADPFSHTYFGEPHKNHSALAQIVMYGLWSMSGHFGLTLYVAVLAVGGLYFLYRAGRGTIYMQGFVLVFGAAGAAAFWSPRPQMFTFFFGAFLLYLLHALKRGGQDRLWLLPPLFWLWGNSHGGYFLGFLFIGAFLLGEWLNHRFGAGQRRIPMRGLRKLLGLSLLSLLLLPLHPLGLGVFAVPLETLAIEGLRDYILEWQAPDFSQPYTWGFLILAALLGIAILTSRRRFDFTEALLVGGKFLLTLFSGRNLSLFTLAAVPITTAHFDALLKRRGWDLPRRQWESPRRALLNLLLVVVVALGALGRLQYVTAAATVEAAIESNFPVAAVSYLNRVSLQGNLFNSYNWGGYLIFAAPGYPVFIDGRADLYHDFLAEYAVAASGTDWQAVFDKWHIDSALIETASPLAQQLQAAAWRLQYRDELASIYRRNKAKT